MKVAKLLNQNLFGKLRWFVYVEKMADQRLTKQIYNMNIAYLFRTWCQESPQLKCLYEEGYVREEARQLCLDCVL